MEYLTPQQVLFIHCCLIAATGLLLRRNGFALTAAPEELYAFTMATGEAGQAESRVWLPTHARREKATV